jgi:hypothetical protein
MLQIVASLIDAARGIIYDRHMFILQATGHLAKQLETSRNSKLKILTLALSYT